MPGGRRPVLRRLLPDSQRLLSRTGKLSPWTRREPPLQNTPAGQPPGAFGQPTNQPSHPTRGRRASTTPARSYPPTAATKPRRGTAFLVALALGAGLLGGVAGAGVVTVLDDDQPATQSTGTQSSLDNSGSESNQSVSSFSSVEDVAAAVLPSVVSISVQSQAGTGTGTGVVISSDGQILTNNHVVESGGNLTVTFHDGTSASAEVVGTDPVTDLAVIQARDVSGLTAAELGSSGDLEVGQQVVAIGSPFGLEGTVTTGIVSAVGRPVSAGQTQDSRAVIDAIQTDAPINPGNSGGPLVNMSGQVVGINSAIYTPSAGSVGLGFAIPIDQAKPIAEELIDTGQATHARIGIGVGPARRRDPGCVDRIGRIRQRSRRGGPGRGRRHHQDRRPAGHRRRVPRRRRQVLTGRATP